MSKYLKHILILLLVSVLAAGMIGCGGNSDDDNGDDNEVIVGGYSDPEDTIRAAFKALEAKDSKKLIGCYVADVQDEIRAKVEYAFSLVDQYKYSDLETQVVSKSDSFTSVEADYDLTITMDGQKTEQHITEIYELTKVNGKWQVLGEATEVEVTEATPKPTATPAAFSSPEGTVLEYYRSIEAMDISDIQKCFRKDLRNLIQPALEEYYSYVDSVSIPVIELQVIDKTDDEATVRANYEIYIIDSGKRAGGPVEEDLHLEKIDGKWLIVDDMGLY